MCFRQPDRTDAVVGLDALLHRGGTDRRELSRYLKARLSWPPARRCQDALALARVRPESPMETKLRLSLVDAGFPTPAVRHEVFHDGRFVARVDLAYPGAKLGIEYDGDIIATG